MAGGCGKDEFLNHRSYRSDAFTHLDTLSARGDFPKFSSTFAGRG